MYLERFAIASCRPEMAVLIRVPRFEPASTERECESLHAGVEELDLECSIPDGLALSHQLIEPVDRDGALPFAVDIRAVIGARWLAVDQDMKSHRRCRLGRTEDEVQIAGVEAVDDSATRGVENGPLALYGPIPFQPSH
jgi:hypothetical protein